MLIAVVNQSTLVNNAEVQLMCQAIQIQLTRDVFPAWNIAGGTVSFYPSVQQVPTGAWTVFIIDNDAQVAGALGYHEEVANKVVGYIMCQPILSNGGVVLNFDATNPGKYTVSGTLSHEIIEMVGDFLTNTYCDNGKTSWCCELCDPVEQIGYGIMVNGINISVSDFVLPQFFNPTGVIITDGNFNFLKTLTAPFTILPGGYAITRTGGVGTEQQVFGELMPQWRRESKTKKFTRAYKRMSKTSLWQKIKNWLYIID